ncbi:ABC transporter ATP-binding protein/permease [Inhella gelatinilytica]|uniref:ABC transporter ATP-binding protein/permease n=1 Tax=Inhella gelatinilytica TaxID=2795030 RepID=A0A931IXF7_9BURK|nr:ABC transporter ATP-binding protein/permease [Inhella gelatinilytica]
MSIARPFWWDRDERGPALGLLVLLMGLLLGQTAFNVLFNQETGEFTSALAARDPARFWSAIGRFVWLLAMAVPIYACYYFVRDTLALRWRRWLTAQFLDRYLAHRAYYHLNAEGALDNPDQRIADDIHAFTGQSLYFSMIVLGAGIQMVAFAGVLWGIAPVLIYVLVGYAVVSTLFTTRLFGRHLIPLNFTQLQREADFRFGLVRLREHAESVALHDGEARERQGLWARFLAAFDNMRRVLRWQLGLNLFQYGHSFLTLVLPSVVVAADVLEGRLEVGRAVQAAGAFGAILSALTLIVEHFEGLSRFSAGIERLHAFRNTLDQPSDQQGIRTAAASELSVQGLSVWTPGREQCLLRDLTFQVQPGQGLLISGASGSGKSSLLRVLAGLWTEGEGRVLRPAGAEMLFLPQQPYLPLGTLREQLLYPQPERGVSDAELQDWLARVQLGDLPERVGGWSAVRDWGKQLSIGEQQRLAFVRALLRRPRYLLLDEATSALDADNEQRLYALLAPLSITPVSVSHHPALTVFHRHQLTLTGAGAWRWAPL